ncbi:pyruvate carboxylase, mitochondrial-like [Culex pipiens pallens]|uniref:pyruvate carboxylase, mitochondrial-like n=1 Tax=Culex pipiens pallens TaxID=42434 RepID=UPI0022AA76B7|nr:pyruvate carboxylase, mitochondrial-like [Culex pipiens pallens]
MSHVVGSELVTDLKEPNDDNLKLMLVSTKTGASGRKQSVGWDTAEAISSSSSVNITNAAVVSTGEPGRVETHPVRAGCEPRRNRYRVFLVCNELGMPSVAIYSEQNRQHMHRQKADESYIDGKGLAPVEVCNTFQKLSGCARRTTSTTCTPVKGHIGPSPKVVQQMGDKVAARKAAIEAGVLIVPETDGPVTIKVEVLVFCKKHGFPVIFKAALSGSSRGKESVKNGRGRRQLRASEFGGEGFRR